MIHRGFYSFLEPTASSKLHKGYLWLASPSRSIDRRSIEFFAAEWDGTFQFYTNWITVFKDGISFISGNIAHSSFLSVLSIFHHSTFSSCLHILDIRLEISMAIFIFIRCQWETDVFNGWQGNAILVNALMPATEINFRPEKSSFSLD